MSYNNDDPTNATETQKFPTGDRETDILLEKSSHHVTGTGALIFATIMLIISALLGYFTTGGPDAEGNLYGGICAGLFAIGGAVLLTVSGMKYYIATKLELPEVWLNVQPVFLGETFTATFSQIAKSHLTVDKVTIAVICSHTYEQRTRNSDGKYKIRRRTNELYRKEYLLSDFDTIEAGEIIQGEFQLDIPRTITADGRQQLARPSREIVKPKYRKTEWLLETKTKISGSPNYTANFQMQVTNNDASNENDDDFFDDDDE